MIKTCLSPDFEASKFPPGSQPDESMTIAPESPLPKAGISSSVNCL